MARAEFAEAKRQVAVTLDALLVDEDVAGAVHRLQRVFALFRFRDEHVLAVLVPVAGLLPQGLVENLRPLHFLVAVLAIDAAHVLLDLLPQRPALGVPEHSAGRVLVDVEQVELTAELAVVTLLGLFQHVQVGVLVFPLGPGRAVDALEHLVVVVATPVGTGHLHQLEDLELARGRHVRATAEVDEIALAVQANLLVFRNGGDDLGLVLLAHALEQLDGVVAAQHFPRDLLVFLGEFAHLLFNGNKVIGREGALVGEVVVKAVLDDRTDGDLRVRIQLLDGVGQQVRRRVTDHVDAVGVLVGDDGELGIMIDRVARVDHLAVHAARQGCLGQACTDALRHFCDSHRAGKLTPGTIRQRDCDHACSCGVTVAHFRFQRCTAVVILSCAAPSQRSRLSNRMLRSAFSLIATRDTKLRTKKNAAKAAFSFALSTAWVDRKGRKTHLDYCRSEAVVVRGA